MSYSMDSVEESDKLVKKTEMQSPVMPSRFSMDLEHAAQAATSYHVPPKCHSDPVQKLVTESPKCTIEPKNLWNIIFSRSCPISNKPCLLIVTGLPDCEKSIFLEKTLSLTNSAVVASASSNSLSSKKHGIPFIELSAVTSSFESSPTYSKTCKETTYLDAIEEAIIKYYFFHYLKESRLEFIVQNDYSVCISKPLNDHFYTMMKELKQRYEKRGVNHTKSQQKTGLTMINIWDISVNKAAFHFLPALWGRLNSSFMWLFFSVDRDIDNFKECPDLSSTKQDDAEQVMPYRTRLRYLIREAMLARTNSKGKPNCSIIGIEKSRKLADCTEHLNSLITAAIQMGVSDIIEKRVIALTSQDDQPAYTLKRKLDEIVTRSQEKKESIPLSFIFLRSFYYSSDEVFVSKVDLKAKAEYLRIFEDGMKRFLDLFSSSGSIIDLDLDFVIMNPMRFMEILHGLFYPNDDIHPDLKEYGLLTMDSAKKIFGEDSVSYFIDVLVAENLAYQIEKDKVIYKDYNQITCKEDIYYIPDVRTTPPDLDNHENSLLLRMGINSSLCHMQVLFAKECLEMNKDYSLRLEKNCHVNVTKFQIGSEVLTMQYLGEVIEFRYENIIPTDYLALVVLDACCNVMGNDKRQTQYNFATKCSKGSFTGADRIAQPHHNVMPNFEKCEQEGTSNNWNEALERITKNEVDSNCTV